MLHVWCENSERTVYDHRPSRHVCFTIFVPDPVWHVCTRCFRFRVTVDASEFTTITLFLGLITTRIRSYIVQYRTTKDFPNSAVSTCWRPRPERVYEPNCPKRSLKCSKMTRLRAALTYTCIIAPLLSEHGQGLGRIRSSVLIFVLAFIYIMRALVYSPHIPDFSRFLSACCTLLWVIDSDGNCIFRRKR